MATVGEERSVVFGGSQPAVGGALKNPFVGNVSKLVPLPPDKRAECAKRGRLQFDACFESGS